MNKFVPKYIKRLRCFEKYIKGEKILCLGARLGHEVVAFRKIGFEDTIGIDLAPGKHNPYVIKGDFHKMQKFFSKNIFDTVYSNSIDHAWNLRRLSKEINRVLKGEGRVIFEIDHFTKKMKRGSRRKLLQDPSKYESIMFDTMFDIKRKFKEFKFITKFLSKNTNFLVVVFEKKSKKNKVNEKNKKNNSLNSSAG